MKIVDGVKYLKIGEVAEILDRSIQTIKIWYEYSTEKGVNLPAYRTDLDKRGTRYWKEEDMPKLIEFQDSIQRGMLTDVTVKKWGKRGHTVKKHYGLDRFKDN